MQRSDGGFGQNNEQNGVSLPIDRRSYLKLAGVAVGSAGLFSGTASAVERHGIRFLNTVDMVSDAGCDPTGNEPCDDKIREAADDYTLLQFPAGEYKITEKNVIFDKTNLGFLGIGDVRFTVPEWFNEKMFVIERGTGLLFENIDIDQTAYAATPGLHLAADDDLQIHDVEFIGQGLNPNNEPQECGNEKIEGCHTNEPVTDALYPIVRSPDGVGVVRNVVARNAGYMGTYTRIGVWIGVSTEGTLRLEDCEFEEFSGNGVYGSRTYGVVQVEGGLYKNNDVSQVRIGSLGSYVENAVIDVDANDTRSPNPWDALNQRGIWFESRKYAGNNPEVRNCDVFITATPNSSGGVVTSSTVDDFSVTDTRIGIDADGVRGVSGYAPSDEGHTAVLRGVSITGSASYSQAIFLKNHPNSVIEECCIHQEGASRDGVWLDGSPGSVVRNSTIDVTGRQVVEEDGWVSTDDISDSGSCPVPDYGLPHTLSIVGNSGRYSYQFSVSGALEKGDAMGAADPNDIVSGNTATGQGGDGGIDSYEFSGEILAFDLDGDVTVYLDGERVNPDQFPENTLSIVSNSGRYSYQFSVSGEIEKSDAMGASIDANDTVKGHIATGQGGGGGIDSYGFSGEILALELDGDAIAYLNGDPLDVSPFPSADVFSIEGNGWLTEYAFSTNGDVTEYSGLSSEDSIAGSGVTGAIRAGRDNYFITGDITDLSLSNTARLFLDEREVDVSEFLPNVVAFDGDGSRTDYSFSVSGGVAPTRRPTSEDEIDIERGRVTGAVGGGKDSYVFSGELTDISVVGDAEVTLNGEVIDVGLPHTLSIAGNSGRYAYQFSVSGALKKGDAMGAADPNDIVSGNTATGQGGDGGIDSYAFSGDITEFSLRGDATVYLDGDEIDLARLLPYTLSIDGDSGYTGYAFVASGGVGPDGGISSEDEIDVERSRVTGAVGRGRDDYRFGGAVTRLSLDSHARIDVDRSARTISISGTGEYASYQLAVTGNIRPTSSLTSEDSISGGNASGAVAGGTDTYRYTGDIVELTIDDGASVTASR